MPGMCTTGFIPVGRAARAPMSVVRETIAGLCLGKQKCEVSVDRALLGGGRLFNPTV